MHFISSAAYFLALLGTIHIGIAIPIDSKNNALSTRQIENFSSSDDSGALYDLGTPVVGTDTWRDDSGVYHDIWKREDVHSRREDFQLQES